MRNPNQLLNLFLDSQDVDSFTKSLSYEEVTMIVMVIELMKINPCLSKSSPQNLELALDFFKEKRKEFIENN